METKIRVGAVSYLNTKPLVYGFEQGLMRNSLDILFDYPAKLSQMLQNKVIDIGLIPVAEIPTIPDAHIISDYCIGASGPVASVCVFSNVPIQEVTAILVDYQSKSSAALLKVLLKKYWKITPALVETAEGYIGEIGNTVAGLVIGDRAFPLRNKYKYVYDLAEAWQHMTGLPFLFAAWVANRPLPESFVKEFNAATGLGLQHLSKIVAANKVTDYDLNTYYTSNIDYALTDAKRKAMQLFLTEIAAL